MKRLPIPISSAIFERHGKMKRWIPVVMLLAANGCVSSPPTTIKPQIPSEIPQSHQAPKEHFNEKYSRLNLAELAAKLKSAAEQGNVHAQCELGQMYFHGFGVARDHRKAEDWFKKAAEQGIAKAQFYIGLVYVNDSIRYKIDSIVSKNDAAKKEFERLNADASKYFSLARPSLMRLAEEGDAESQLMLGWMYKGMSDSKRDKLASSVWLGKALENFKKSGEQGNATATRNIVKIYSLLQDDMERIKWLTRAANQGDPTAQFELGLHYKLSESSKDYSKAIEYLRKAAEQEYCEAQYELARMLDTGAWPRGFSEAFLNDAAAIEWYKKAAQRNHVEAQYQLGMEYRYNTEIMDYDEAIKWYTMAAEQGHLEAQVDLAYAYYLGDEAPQDYQKAFKWAKIVAEKEGIRCVAESRAQGLYADMYFHGRGVAKDYGKAIKLYTELGLYGNSFAQYRLGRIYYEGLGIEKNVKTSAMWFARAAESGYAVAQFCLAEMYYEGEGIIQDYVEAYKWANLATMRDERYSGFRDTIKKEMTPEQIAEGQKRAREFYEKHEKRTR